MEKEDKIPFTLYLLIAILKDNIEKGIINVCR